ncbi:MAG: prephenate dehydrogenase [Actinobacteria bacterium]|nr:prephenate dehydrogenase [Actinomycetota bacterium]
MSIAQVRIVGTGLIGTSIALGLAHKGIRVIPTDINHENEKLARDLLAPSLGDGAADLTILATPPQATLEALRSGKFLGTHPMAGRERGGARASQSDLFQGRAWFITPTNSSDRALISDARFVAETLGATVYEISPDDHDRLMAAISHLPQVVSSALASSINDLPRLDLAGQGLRDMVRIASSDPALWSEILFANRENILNSLENFRNSLDSLREAIADEDSGRLVEIFRTGAEARTKASGKHGALPRNYVELLIVIDDRPGQLSRLFQECAEVNANIEDLSIEHSPGQETGLISLSFSSIDAEKVMKHLETRGWKVHQA